MVPPVPSVPLAPTVPPMPLVPSTLPVPSTSSLPSSNVGVHNRRVDIPGTDRQMTVQSQDRTLHYNTSQCLLHSDNYF